jgi:hypothetical protein
MWPGSPDGGDRLDVQTRLSWRKVVAYLSACLLARRLESCDDSSNGRGTGLECSQATSLRMLSRIGDECSAD